MSVGRFLQQGAAGNAGGATYVDDVFSTYLYDGANGSTSNQAVTVSNGIDLYNEGGLIWIKRRDVGNGHALFDSQRDSFASYLRTEGTNAQSTLSGHVTANSNGNGFTLSSTGYGITNNTSPATYTSWTFRKQPGFFDVVTYTGDGTSNRNISHNLNSAPGAIFIKRTDSASSTGWMVWHRSGSPQSGTYGLMLNYTNSWGNIGADIWGTSGPNMTSTTFSVGNYSDVNASGGSYVAYLFAHDAQDFGTGSDESIIKCGSYTGTGTNPNNIDLGFEPQWLLLRRVDSASSWIIFDNMRGVATGGDDALLYPNLSSAEAPSSFIDFNSTGFNAAPTQNASGGSYIYIAIRRPHKPASEFAATDLFDQQYGTVTTPVVTTGFPVDFFIQRNPNGTDGNYFYNRLTDKKYLQSNSTAAEGTGGLSRFFDFSDGVMSSYGSAASYLVYSLRRAPGFFDVVAYTGTGVSGLTVTHNLTVSPQLVILKNRTTSSSWFVLSNVIDGSVDYGNLNAADAFVDSSWFVMNSSNFIINTTGTATNAASNNYITYLFATAPGISKVGSYSGSGSDIEVDCGFTSGARFVLIKKINATGHWYLWDAERGITAGADPHLKLNSTSAQQTGSAIDINPYSSGFSVPSGDAAVNTSGNTYLFLAIA